MKHSETKIIDGCKYEPLNNHTTTKTTPHSNNYRIVYKTQCEMTVTLADLLKQKEDTENKIISILKQYRRTLQHINDIQQIEKHRRKGSCRAANTNPRKRTTRRTR